MRAHPLSPMMLTTVGAPVFIPARTPDSGCQKKASRIIGSTTKFVRGANLFAGSHRTCIPHDETASVGRSVDSSSVVLCCPACITAGVNHSLNGKPKPSVSPQANVTFLPPLRTSLVDLSLECDRTLSFYGFRVGTPMSSNRGAWRRRVSAVVGGSKASVWAFPRRVRRSDLGVPRHEWKPRASSGSPSYRLG
jgi:hypothetical protein